MFKQWVASVVEEQASCAGVAQNYARCACWTGEAPVPIRVLMVTTQNHFYAVVVFGEAGFRELQFQFAERFFCGVN